MSLLDDPKVWASLQWMAALIGAGFILGALLRGAMGG